MNDEVFSHSAEVAGSDDGMICNKMMRRKQSVCGIGSPWYQHQFLNDEFKDKLIYTLHGNNQIVKPIEFLWLVSPYVIQELSPVDWSVKYAEWISSIADYPPTQVTWSVWTNHKPVFRSRDL